MPIRRSAWALAAAAALGAACTVNAPAPLHSPSQSLAADQALRVRLIDPLNTVDPALASNPSELAVTRQLAEPLLKGGPGLRDVEPAAAETVEVSGDGLTATFHLRANGRFADGRAVTAADFVEAWRRVIDPNTLSPAADNFAAVVSGGEAAQSLDPKRDADRLRQALDGLGLKAVDPLTFQVTLPRPASQLRWVATLVQGSPAGNGPFRLVSHTKTAASLAGNESYWGGRPTLSKLSFEVIPDDALALARYRAGELDVAQSTAGQPGPAGELLKVPLLSEYWLTFNTARPPFDNVKVRQAFAMALDRAAIVKEAFAGRAEPATSLLPNGMRDHRAELGRPQELNPGQARQLLDASGASKEQLSSIHFLVRASPLEKAVADSAAAQVKQNLGLTLTVDDVPVAEGGQRLRAGDFQMGGVDGWAADYPDAQNWFDLFRSNDGNNLSRWRNERYDLLVRQADGEADPSKRDDLYVQATETLVGEAPVAFLAQLDGWYLVKPYVKGLVVTSADEWPGAAHSPRIYINAH